MDGGQLSGSLCGPLNVKRRIAGKTCAEQVVGLQHKKRTLMREVVVTVTLASGGGSEAVPREESEHKGGKQAELQQHSLTSPSSSTGFQALAP